MLTVIKALHVFATYGMCWNTGSKVGKGAKEISGLSFDYSLV